jgi:hypothetical protein
MSRNCRSIGRGAVRILLISHKAKKKERKKEKTHTLSAGYAQARTEKTKKTLRRIAGMRRK